MRAVNINSSVVFERFEDFKKLIILNALKEKLVIFRLVGSFELKTV